MADIRAVIAEMEPVIRAAFMDAIRDITSEAQIGVIVAALQEGRVDDAVRALRLGPAFFSPLDDAVRAAYIAGGRDALSGLPAISDPFLRGAWWFALMGAIRALNSGSEPVAAR